MRFHIVSLICQIYVFDKKINPNLPLPVVSKIVVGLWQKNVKSLRCYVHWKCIFYSFSLPGNCSFIFGNLFKLCVYLYYTLKHVFFLSLLWEYMNNYYRIKVLEQKHYHISLLIISPRCYCIWTTLAEMKIEKKNESISVHIFFLRHY